MTASPLAPKLAQGGIVLMDPVTAEVKQVISMQYYPDSVQRTLQPQPVQAAGGDRLEALRLRGPAVETVRVELEIDATDWLEHPDADNAADVGSHYGLLPQLAVLETMLSPPSASLKSVNSAVENGVLEISPTEALLTVVVWNRRRAVPVRITEYSAVEEAFDTALNPTRVRLTLTLRVLTTSDLPWRHPGNDVYLQHLEQQEEFVKLAPKGSIGDVGLSTVPGR